MLQTSNIACEIGTPILSSLKLGLNVSLIKVATHLKNHDEVSSASICNQVSYYVSLIQPICNRSAAWKHYVRPLIISSPFFSLNISKRRTHRGESDS